MLTFTTPAGMFWCSLESWQRLFALAREQGWTPSGIPEPILTEPWDPLTDEPPPLPPPWGNAQGPLRLRIAEEDAASMADALENALPDIPRFDALSEKTLFRIDSTTMIPVRVLKPGVRVSHYEYFSGANRVAMERFISLLRSGPVIVS
jgi:hypothetical protein